jgi:hypothetical protein
MVEYMNISNEHDITMLNVKQLTYARQILDGNDNMLLQPPKHVYWFTLNSFLLHSSDHIH